MSRSDVTLGDRVRLLQASRRSTLINAVESDLTWHPERSLSSAPCYWRTSALINYCLTECVHVPGVPDGK